jgi:hypothetical protein
MSNMLFQQLKRIADGWRRNFKFPRGCRDISFTRNALKDADLIIKSIIHSIFLKQLPPDY